MARADHRAMNGTRSIARRIGRAGAAALAPALRAAPAATAAAPDERFPSGGVAMEVARGIAVAHWGKAPCGGHVTVEWADMASTTNATSSWSAVGSPYAAPERNTDCRIRFNRQIAYDWERFCTVYVHEMGHLAGNPHVAEAGNVMASVYGGPLGICSATADPTSHTVTAPEAPHTIAASGPGSTAGALVRSSSSARGRVRAPRTRSRARRATVRSTAAARTARVTSSCGRGLDVAEYCETVSRPAVQRPRRAAVARRSRT